MLSDLILQLKHLTCMQYPCKCIRHCVTEEDDCVNTKLSLELKLMM